MYFIILNNNNNNNIEALYNDSFELIHLIRID